MAKFIIRDAEGHVEKIVDKKMHAERRKQDSTGCGCMALLVIVIGVIVYFSLLKEKDCHVENETEVVSDNPQFEKIEKEVVFHPKKEIREPDTFASKTEEIPQVVEDVVREVVEGSAATEPDYDEVETNLE